MSAGRSGKSKTNKNAVRKAENIAKAIQLRKAGLTYQAIGDQLGVSVSQAHKYVAAALSQYAITTGEAAEEYKTLQSARLEGLITALEPKASAGNLGAIKEYRSTIETLGKLHGLFAPTKIAPVSPDGTQEFTGGGLASLLRPGE